MTDDRTRAEAELARSCAAGDAAAWERLVEGYGGLLAAVARRMLERRVGRSSTADVDEVVAGVFLALLRRDRDLLRRYDPRWRLSTWLGVICRTEVTRHVRRRRRSPRASLEVERLEDGGAGPLARLADRERAAALGDLRAGLETLAPRDRLLLTLRYLEGLDYRAIAEAVGVSPESVGPLLSRAKARLARAVPHLRALVEQGPLPPGDR